MADDLFVNVKTSVVNFLYETTVTARVGCIVLTILYILSYFIDTLTPLGITPGHVILPNFWIWTFFTHQFVECNLILLIASCIILIQSSKILESVWSVSDFTIFFWITTVLSGITATFFYLMCYMITFKMEYLFYITPLHGFAGYVGGFLVALKQCHGDEMLLGAIGMQVKYLPLAHVCLWLFVNFFVGILRGYFLLALTGSIVSWTYLRFYQSHRRGRGDNAENFSFRTFFPKPIDEPVGVVADAIFNVLLQFKICQKISYEYDVGNPSTITITLSGVHADTERRRSKALKALDERLQKSQNVIVLAHEPDRAGIISTNEEVIDEKHPTSPAISPDSDIIKTDADVSLSDGNGTAVEILKD